MNIDFSKGKKLVPAVIQDASTNIVLMLGYMNEEAYQKTIREHKVTFYSRSKKHLWTKGETSGNYLYVKKIMKDCDSDTLLIKVNPAGPVCHTGADTCFAEENVPSNEFLAQLEKIIKDRKKNPKPKSYTNHLFNSGIKKISQKVGEEATEVIIEALNSDRERLKNEAADLVYHLLVLLSEKEISLSEVVRVLEKRHKR